ncbi:hypothetical protein FLA4_09800 [Candidatus Rickettsia kotlanii]|nr:hypothetical protein FLA4_09800 [Candidatus Rickettsia kotlanii]BDU61813.1 hypothetical protein HM2_09810 [Candidatus Rickettsia kotlanii]
MLDSESDLNLSLDSIANLCYSRIIICETEEDTLSIDDGVFAAFWWAVNYIIDKVLMLITDNIYYYLREKRHYETSSYQSYKGASKDTYYNHCSNVINETKQHYHSALDKHKEVVLGYTTTFFWLVWW